jgi:hypothetical protein
MTTAKAAAKHRIGNAIPAAARQASGHTGESVSEALFFEILPENARSLAYLPRHIAFWGKRFLFLA